MKNVVKQTVKRIIYGPLSPIASITFRIISNLQYKYFNNKWERQGWKKPSSSEIDFVRENVTIIYKSFESQNMAKRLYRNIQSYYPGVRVIIADDSSRPLDLQDDSLQVI